MQGVLKVEDIYFQNSFRSGVNLLLVLSILAVLLWRLKREKLSPVKGVVLFAMRFVSFILVLIALQNPMIWSTEVVREKKQMVLVVDDSLSMNVKNGDTTRWQAVSEAVEKITSSELNKKFLFPLVRFSRPWDTEVENYNASTMDNMESFSPNTNETHVETVTWNQIKRFDSRKKNMAGIILLTDGRSTEDVQDWGNIDRANVTIHSVLPYGTEAFDSRVSSLVGNEYCRQGDTIHLVADIQHQGPAITTEVALYQGNELLEHKSITLDKKVLSVDFKVPMDKVGWQRMSVRLLADDPVVENNERSVMVRVLEDSLKVLLVSGLPHYDFRYVREAMERDNSVDLSVYLQSAEKMHPGWSTSLTHFPRDLKEFLKYDVVILQDVDVYQIEEYSWIALRRFVEEAHGALLLQAGYNFSFPQSVVGMPFEKMLPHVPSSSGMLRDSFYPQIIHPLFAAVMPKEAGDWPSFYWAASIKSIPPLTQVVWQHPTEKTEDGKALPLVSWCRQGRGKVGYVGLANMWRLRSHGEDFSHYGFYSTFIRHLADNRYSGQDKLIRFKVGTEGNAVTGKEERIHIEVHDASLNPHEAKEIICQLVTPSKTQRMLALPSLGEGVYELGISFEEVGVHILSVKIGEEVKEYQFVVHLSNREFEDISLGIESMTDLSQRSNGRMVMLKKGEIEKFISSLNKMPDEVRRQHSHRLWNTGLFGLLLFSLLIMEWVLRRLWSLP